MSTDEFYCNTTTTTPLNPSFFPVGSAVFDPNFDILPFLCQLLGAATNDSIDPVLKMPDEYDMAKHVDFTQLLNVGDPRYSDGAILSAAFINFLPRMITQVEVKAAGGSQVINNYICDPDGNPIKESMTIPVLTTVGTGGINLYGYDIPSGLNEVDLMKKLTAEEVYSFVNNYISSSVKINADYFIAYLQKYYPKNNWNYSLHAFKNPQYFYVQLDNINNGTIVNSVYIKYHYDAQTYVAQTLASLGIIPPSAPIDLRNSAKFDNNITAKLFSKKVLDYKSLMEDTNLGDSNSQLNLTTFSAPPSANYRYAGSVTTSLSGLNTARANIILNLANKP